MSARPIAVVTGGAGFIGSHTVDLLLARGYAVRVIDDISGGREANLAEHSREPALAFERKDVRGIEPGDPLFRDARYVFHFAGLGDLVPSIERPAEYVSVNVAGTVAVLEAARAAAVDKFVYAASSSCYGLAEVPTAEDHPIAPQHPYALSKYLGECAALHWQQSYGLAVVSIRIFNAYGPRVGTTGAYGAVFGVFLRQKLAGAPLTIVGDGMQERDFVYVTDVAEGFLRAAESDVSGEIFNVGSGKPRSIRSLSALLGGEIVHLPDRPGEPRCTWADISRIRARLDWEPTVAFEDGVSAMLERIDEWKDTPLWDAAAIADATRAWFGALGDSPRTTAGEA